MIDLSPAGRPGTPDEVGTVGALLMGADGAFITGSDFLMDGGVTASISTETSLQIDCRRRVAGAGEPDGPARSCDFGYGVHKQTGAKGKKADRMSDDEREHPCAAVPIPATLSAELEGYEWARDIVGESGGAVYRLHGRSGSPDLFLKHGEGVVADDVTDEMTRLRWLAGHLPVPAVVHFVRTHDQAWLLMTAIPGKTAYQVLESRPDAGPAVVDALVIFLLRLHAIPVRECPFNSDHAFRLSRARTRVDAGLVEADDFDEEREGWTAEQVWTAMHKLLPFAPDPVVTHGDFSLDNLLIRDGEVVGCIDVGRVGIADRYQDLAILWNCLGEFDPSLQERLFRRYGILDVDRRKIQFHLMLDELF